MQSNSAIVLFYGLPLAGKRTTLRYLSSKLNPGDAPLPIEGGSGPSYEELPIKTGAAHLLLRALSFPDAIRDGGYTLYRSAQAQLLKEADAAVLVFDGQVERLDANMEVVSDFWEHLASRGMTRDAMPIVQQHNKSDLPNYSGGLNLATNLSLPATPWFPTCANSGDGVFDVLKAMTRLLVQRGRLSLK